MALGVPDPIDIHVGGRLRLARKACGLSQTSIADALGISFQQVQKYENGASRLGASRLYRLARLFDVSVGFFFRDMPAEIADTIPQGGHHSMRQNDDLEGLRLGAEGRNREVLRLVTRFLQIPNLKLRTEIITFVIALQRSLAAGRSSSR